MVRIFTSTLIAFVGGVWDAFDEEELLMDDCNCDSGAVTFCRRFPCPRRTCDPIVNGVPTFAPPPSLGCVIMARLRGFWRSIVRS